MIAMKIHPQVIIAGYRKALNIAQEALKASAKPSGCVVLTFVLRKNCIRVVCSRNMREDLLKIARTTLGSKILSQHKEHFAELAVKAVLRLKGSDNLGAIQIIKKLGGAMDESYLDEGFLLEKKPGMYQPKRVEDAKILIANTPMDTDKVYWSAVCLGVAEVLCEIKA
uniref:Uncharacterized protein n=1 Tax=Parascaris equorum TaxID=6256 RepID=A0A914RUK8_PAREQ